MALTFPLSLAAFIDKLGTAEVTFSVKEALGFSLTRAGETISSDVAPRLWQGRVAIAGDLNRVGAEAAALINVIKGAGATFFVRHKSFIGPRNDPYGTLVSGYSPVVSAANANFRTLTLSGLPANYKLAIGDKLSWVYSGRYALHEVVENVTASAGGVATFDIQPPMRSGVAPGIAVVLVKPFCKATYVPQSYEEGSVSGPFTQGLAFSWMQTLR